MEEFFIKKLILCKDFLIASMDYQRRFQNQSLNILIKDKASAINFQSFSKIKTFLDVNSNALF